MTDTRDPNVTYAPGDIFATGADMLVNPVNCVGAMGKGLSLAFRRRFPVYDADYRALCRKGRIRPGEVTLWTHCGGTPPTWIASFPTKDHWRDPSRLEWIEDGLASLRDAILRRHPTCRSVAIPRLGCGLGGLAFTDVAPRIERALGNLPHTRVIVLSDRP